MGLSSSALLRSTDEVERGIGNPQQCGTRRTRTRPDGKGVQCCRGHAGQRRGVGTSWYLASLSRKTQPPLERVLDLIESFGQIGSHLAIEYRLGQRGADEKASPRGRLAGQVEREGAVIYAAQCLAQ